MTDIRIKVGLGEELLARVDEARGDVPRERWLRRLVEEHFEAPRDRSAKGNGWSTKVERQPVFETPDNGSLAGHEWVGTKDACMRMGCQFSRNRKAH